VSHISWRRCVARLLSDHKGIHFRASTSGAVRTFFTPSRAARSACRRAGRAASTGRPAAPAGPRAGDEQHPGRPQEGPQVEGVGVEKYTPHGRHVIATLWGVEEHGCQDLRQATSGGDADHARPGAQLGSRRRQRVPADLASPRSGSVPFTIAEVDLERGVPELVGLLVVNYS
jgi:hypothetical protein